MRHDLVAEIQRMHLRYDAVCDRVGVGSFGTVYRAVWKGSSNLRLQEDDEVAVKLMKNGADIVASEVATMTTISHKNIVGFFGVSYHNADILLVTEYCSGGSLYSYLHEPGPDGQAKPLGYDIICLWALDMAKGVEYLHESLDPAFAHRDLKSQNVLVQRERKSRARRRRRSAAAGDRDVLKLCDFGCSSKMDKVDEDAAEIGTYRWMAPELIRREEGETVDWLLCDMYSLGVIYWEMLARDLPFGRNTTSLLVYMMVAGGEQLPVPEAPTAFKRIVEECVGPAAERPKASDVAARLMTMGGTAKPDARDWVEQRAWENSLEDRVARQQAKYLKLYSRGQQKEVVMIGMAITIVVFVLILLNPSKTDAQKEQAHKIFAEFCGDDGSCDLTELRAAYAALKLNVNDTRRVIDAYDVHEQVGSQPTLDVDEFTIAVITENTYYGWLRQLVSRGTRAVFGVDISVGNILRDAKARAGNPGLFIPGVALLAISVSRVIESEDLQHSGRRSFQPTHRVSPDQIFDHVILLLGAIMVSTACLDEVSGIEVAKLVLVIMGLTWSALLAATWQRSKVELVRRPAEPGTSPEAFDHSADADGRSADDCRPSSPSVTDGQST